MSSSSKRVATRLLFCLSCAVPALIASFATAQDAGTELDTITVRGADETKGIGLNAPAASASRTRAAIKDIPASVSVVGKETIAERGQHSLSDAITQNATGVTSVAAPAFGTAYALRGFQGNNSVMQVYDGTRLFPGRGNITFPYDSWLAERVEVLNGAGSVIHGSGAIGGTIDVAPKRPFSGPIRNQATVMAGSDGRLRAGLDSGGSLGERLSYRLAAVGDRTDGWIDSDKARSLAVTGSLIFEATPELKFTLSADHGRQKPSTYLGTPMLNGKVVPGTEDLNYNVRDAENDFRDRWLQLRSEWTPTEALTVTNTVYGIGSDRDFRNAETYLWDAATNQVTVDEFRRIRQEQRQVGTRTELRADHGLFGLDSETVLGFDINHAKSSFADYASYGARIVDPFDPDAGYFPAGSVLTPKYRSTLDQQSVFAENRTELGGGFSLSTGLRQDWLDLERTDLVSAASSFSARYDAPSARAGLTWKPNEATAIYGQFAWATDPVNLPLLDYAQSMRDFKLTTGRQFEIGVKQSVFDDRAEWSIAAYDIVKRNVLVIDPGTWSFQQAGQQSSQGIEIASSVAVTDTLRVSGNAAFTRARFDDFTSIDWTTFAVVDYAGKVPLLVPEVSANLWASWNFRPDWTLHAGLQFVGKSFYDYANTTTRDAFTLVNAGLDWKPDADTALAFRVKNIFNEKAVAYLRTDPNTERAQAILGAPRQFELQLTRRF